MTNVFFSGASEHVLYEPISIRRLLELPEQTERKRTELVKRRLDRFRFLHKGIGKRSTALTDLYFKTIASDKKHSSFHEKINALLQRVQHFREQRTYDKQYLFANSPDLLLENTKTFRILRGLNYLFDKRTPESFSENLYPIQAGKQQFEATLDKTLNRNVEHFSNDIVDIAAHAQIDDHASHKPEQTSDNQHETMQSEIDTPFDLSFASPDLGSKYHKADKYKPEIDEKHKNTGEDTREDTEEDTGGERSKRWWAAKMLSRFRSPKSWNGRVTTARHVDPAIYFIGLGK